MKNPYYLLLINLLLFIAPINCVAGGMSSWSETTPYGHEMRHEGSSDGIIELYIPSNMVRFKHFYFYKKHIIAHGNNKFYIINEKTATVQEFTNREDWEEQIKKQNLKPIWKREYDYGFRSLVTVLFFLLFFFPPLFLPLVWLICLINVILFRKKKNTFSKRFLLIYSSMFFLLWLLKTFPQSI